MIFPFEPPTSDLQYRDLYGRGTVSSRIAKAEPVRDQMARKRSVKSSDGWFIDKVFFLKKLEIMWIEVICG